MQQHLLFARNRSWFFFLLRPQVERSARQLERNCAILMRWCLKKQSFLLPSPPTPPQMPPINGDAIWMCYGTQETPLRAPFYTTESQFTTKKKASMKGLHHDSSSEQSMEAAGERGVWSSSHARHLYIRNLSSSSEWYCNTANNGVKRKGIKDNIDRFRQACSLVYTT